MPFGYTVSTTHLAGRAGGWPLEEKCVPLLHSIVCIYIAALANMNQVMLVDRYDNHPSHIYEKLHSQKPHSDSK